MFYTYSPAPHPGFLLTLVFTIRHIFVAPFQIRSLRPELSPYHYGSRLLRLRARGAREWPRVAARVRGPGIKPSPVLNPEPNASRLPLP